MKNVYQFTYYGAWWWENEEEAEAVMETDLAQLGVEDPGGWQVIEVSEQRLKLLNVKLNNDPRRAVTIADDGAVTVGVKE